MNLAANTLRLASLGGLSCARTRELLARGGQLVDVRSAAEFSRDALPGALNIPIESLSYEHHFLRRERPVIVYGARGFRSGRAAQLLARHGFQQVFHLDESRVSSAGRLRDCLTDGFFQPCQPTCDSPGRRALCATRASRPSPKA